MDPRTPNGLVVRLGMLFLLAFAPHLAAQTSIFQEDFESGNFSQWDDGVNSSKHFIVNDPMGSGRGKVLEMKYLSQFGGDAGWLTNFFPNVNEAWVEFDNLFPSGWVRNTKLMAFYGGKRIDPWSGFGQAGICPSGTDYFVSMIVTDSWIGDPEPFRFYTYYPAMSRESDGITCWGRYGPSANTMERIKIGQWQKIRFHVRLNTPGQSDGRQRFWIDGNLISDWSNISFGDTNVLALNSIQITGSANSPQNQSRYVDNLKVFPGSPDGPSDTAPPAAPINLVLRP